jgi:ABC-type polysaccharide/polyol phosphate transport system ATPase subunit
MPHSRVKKISWFFGSNGPSGRATIDSLPPIELRDVSLRFRSYHDKQYTLKRAALDLILRRAEPPARSEFAALSNVDLRIGAGERVGIIGGNGAGKSTLLRVLARIYPPTAGVARIRGVVAPLIEMGAGFNHELSGKENILLNGAMLGFSRKQMLEKVPGVLDFTGLNEFADLPLKYYSSGMYMRLAFAIATEVEPDVLLIDESLGVGDAAFVDKAKARIRDVMNKAKVVVVVSHDMAALRELCDRGVQLERGRIVRDGPIDETIDAYIEHVHQSHVA